MTPLIKNIVRESRVLVPSTYTRAVREGIGKAIPLQAWTGPEGSRRLRLPDFKKIGT
jgi:hypothetical protein